MYVCNRGIEKVWHSEMSLFEKEIVTASLYYIHAIHSAIQWSDQGTDDFYSLWWRTITAGTLGGFIATSRNLSQSGTAWVFLNGKIEGKASVSGNALIASGGEVLGNAKVYENATVGNNGTVTGDADVSGQVYWQAKYIRIQWGRTLPVDR